MGQFLVETYLPAARAERLDEAQAQVTGAAEQLSRSGRPVRYLRSIVVPEDETCFWLFESRSQEDLAEVLALAQIDAERVMPAQTDSAAAPGKP